MWDGRPRPSLEFSQFRHFSHSHARGRPSYIVARAAPPAIGGLKPSLTGADSATDSLSAVPRTVTPQDAAAWHPIPLKRGAPGGRTYPAPFYGLLTTDTDY